MAKQEYENNIMSWVAQEGERYLLEWEAFSKQDWSQ